MDHTTITKRYLLNNVRSGQAGEYDLRIICDCFGIDCASCTKCLQAIDGSFVEVEHRECEASLNQATSHWLAHGTQANESECWSGHLDTVSSHVPFRH
ncbi:hypothetical protein D3C75_677420 [compost metagenome]